MSEKTIGKGIKSFVHKINFNVPRHFHDIDYTLSDLKLTQKKCSSKKILTQISYTPVLNMGSITEGPKSKVKAPRQSVEEEIPIIKCIYEDCCEKVSSGEAKIELSFSKQPKCIVSSATRGRGRMAKTDVDLIVKGEITAEIKE